MHKTYTWEYRIELPPYDMIVAVLEAFFASYAAGDYTCEHREQYKLRFRRGQWKRTWFGIGHWEPIQLVKGQFREWPVVVQVLVRPSPQTFHITVRYELHLPAAIGELAPEVQASVDQHARRELGDLADYLAECAGLASAPPVVSA